MTPAYVKSASSPPSAAGSARRTTTRRVSRASAATASGWCAASGGSSIGAEPLPLPPYSRDWGEAGAREPLAEAARR